MKKYLLVFLSLFLLSSSNNSNKIFSKSDYEEREDYYIRMCYGSVNPENETLCNDFMDYIDRKNEKYKREIEEMELEESILSENIEKYTEKVNEYIKEIERIDNRIKTLEEKYKENFESSTKKTQEMIKLMDEYSLKRKDVSENLNTISVEIELLAEEIDDIEYVQKRDILLQILLDVLNDEMKNLSDIYVKVHEIDESREEDKAIVEKAAYEKEKLNESKMLSESMKMKTNLMISAYKSREAELVATRVQKIADLNSLKGAIERNKQAISGIIPSDNWGKIMDIGTFTLSSDAWYYPESFGGGVHLGNDFAANMGTNIYAPANGVILYSSNACSEIGYLGNVCGEPGVPYGGNQTFLITIVDEKVFVLAFYHLSYNSVLSTGTVVKQGDVIAKVGSTGNSTGNHLHLEAHYIGKSTDLTDVIDNWDGDMGFGNLWGENALNWTCDSSLNKSHCRVNPRLLLNIN